MPFEMLTSHVASEGSKPNSIPKGKMSIIQVNRIPSPEPKRKIDWESTSMFRKHKNKINKEEFRATMCFLEEKREKDRAIKEAQGLKDQLLCKICFDNPVKITMVPCGHLATCSECSKPLQQCPICRGPISAKQATFM